MPRDRDGVAGPKRKHRVGLRDLDVHLHATGGRRGIHSSSCAIAGERGLVAHQHEAAAPLDRCDSPDLARKGPPGCPAPQRSPSAMPRPPACTTISTSSSSSSRRRGAEGVSVRITGRSPVRQAGTRCRSMWASTSSSPRSGKSRRTLAAGSGKREARQLRTAEHHSDHARREAPRSSARSPAEPRRLSPNPFAGRHRRTLRQAGAHGHAPPPARLSRELEVSRLSLGSWRTFERISTRRRRSR